MSLSALLERVEGATGGDRELDRDIAIATGWVHRSGAPWERVLEWERPNPTASVDAALALIGRVLPGLYMWRLEFDDEPTDWPYETRVYSAGGSERGYNASHKTPALALCAALLAAMIGEEAKP